MTHEVRVVGIQRRVPDTEEMDPKWQRLRGHLVRRLTILILYTPLRARIDERFGHETFHWYAAAVSEKLPP